MSKKMRLSRSSSKIWNYIKYRFLPKRAIMSARRYTPQIGSIHLTNRCNLNCGYCNAAKIYQQNVNNWQEKDADLEKIKRISDNLLFKLLFKNCLLIDLLGGEPLLINDLDSIIAHLSDRGHIVNVSTNGLLLADRIIDLKNAGIGRINVSLYDANQAIIEKNLEKINKIFPVHASIVLLRSEIEQKIDELLEKISFIHSAGCLSLRFWMYRPMGTNPQISEIIPENHPAYLEFRRRVENILPGFCVWPSVVKTKPIQKLCSQLWQRINCDSLDNMGICCGMDIGLQGLNSNLFENEPDIIFNHPTLVNMRRKMLDLKCEPPIICKNCNLLGESGW